MYLSMYFWYICWNWNKQIYWIELKKVEHCNAKWINYLIINENIRVRYLLYNDNGFLESPYTILNFLHFVFRGEIDDREWRFLLTGGVALENPFPNPAPNWLSDKSWAEVVRVSQLDAFDDFMFNFRSNVSNTCKVNYLLIFVCIRREYEMYIILKKDIVFLHVHVCNVMLLWHILQFLTRKMWSNTIIVFAVNSVLASHPFYECIKESKININSLSTHLSYIRYGCKKHLSLPQEEK